MARPIVFTHKRGDTFKFAVELTQDGVAIDMTGWTVRCHVKRGPALIVELDFAWIDASLGKFEFTAENTSDWPIETLTSDIEYTRDTGVKFSSETFEIDCIRDETV